MANWIFVEDAHLFQVALATSLGGVAAAVLAQRDWFTRLNAHAQALLNQHPDVPTVVRKAMRNFDIFTDDDFFNLVDHGEDPVLLIRPRAGGMTYAATTPWFEWFALLSDLRLTVADGVTDIVPSHKVLLARALRAPRCASNANVYTLLSALTHRDVGIESEGFSDGLGPLVLKTLSAVRTDLGASCAFANVLRAVTLSGASTSQWPLWRHIMATSIAEHETVDALSVFYDFHWRFSSWREHQYFKIDTKPLLALGRRLIDAYAHNQGARFDALMVFAQYVRNFFFGAFHVGDIITTFRSQMTNALMRLPFPTDPEDGECLRRCEALRQWIMMDCTS